MSISIRYKHTTMKYSILTHKMCRHVAYRTQLTQKHLFYPSLLSVIFNHSYAETCRHLCTRAIHIFMNFQPPPYTHTHTRTVTHSTCLPYYSIYVYKCTKWTRTYISHSNYDDNNSILLAFTLTPCLSFINCFIFSTPAFSHHMHMYVWLTFSSILLHILCIGHQKHHCTQTITSHAQASLSCSCVIVLWTVWISLLDSMQYAAKITMTTKATTTCFVMILIFRSVAALVYRHDIDKQVISFGIMNMKRLLSDRINKLFSYVQTSMWAINGRDYRYNTIIKQL